MYSNCALRFLPITVPDSMSSRDFLSVFSAERTGYFLRILLMLEILKALSSLPGAKDEALATLESIRQRHVKLNGQYTQNASSLPTYDQRRCQEVLKAINTAENSN